MTGPTDVGHVREMTVAARPHSEAPSPAATAPVYAQKHRPNRFVTVAGWGLILIACAAVFELTCRVEDWVMYRMPLDSPYRSIEDLAVRDADGMHGRPNAQFQRWIMNAVGTRGRPASVVPAAGTVRVITVGASETFGLRESPGREYPSQLEDSLNARLTRLGCKDGPDSHFEVLNAGFAGMSLPTTDQDVRNRLKRLRPSIITAYSSSVAYLADPAPAAARPDSSNGGTTPGIRAVLHPRALERLRDQLKLMLPDVIKSRLRQREIDADVNGHDANWRFTTVPPERLAAFELDLHRLVGTIRSIGAAPILVTHADAFMGRSTVDSDMLTAWQKFLPRATGATIIAFDSLARFATLRVAADSGVVVVDAASRFANAPASSFADAVHFTDRGAAIMASTLADGVLTAHPVVRECSTR